MYSKDEVKKILEVLDKDKNGKVSAKELLDFLNSNKCPLPADDVKKFVKEFDKDKDGELDLDELVKIFSD